MENKRSSTIRFLITIIIGSLCFLGLGAGIAYFSIQNEKENLIAATKFCKTLSQEENFEYYAAKSEYETNIFKCELSNNKNTLPQNIVSIRKNFENGKFEINIPDYQKG